MLVCDRCSKGWHMVCMTPPMDVVPAGRCDAPPSSLLDPKRVQLCQIAEVDGTWCHS
jgi:hypothetical protein